MFVSDIMPTFALRKMMGVLAGVSVCWLLDGADWVIAVFLGGGCSC